ncbi:MAG: glycosyltransferase family 4 protein [Ruminococcaceae bacterium]|nr:glycosyltransferase family 4 protein [Oscillospiraceae bacterium]
MKILYVTTVGATMTFFNKFIEELIQCGHTVDIATNESHSKVPACYHKFGCKIYQIDTSRSPLNKGNFTAIKQIKRIVRENKYDIVHCHTPLAAMCTRLACEKLRKNGVKVIYTAHGFHFYKGAPLKNWLVYYPIEKLCSHFTDVLITMNNEDYALAEKKMKAKRVEYVPGVGVDIEKFSKQTIDKTAKRRELGIPEDAVVLLSVGELIVRKNHETVIRAVSSMGAYYLIAGEGRLDKHLQAVINTLGVSDKVKLLGHRDDVKELYEMADVFVFPSFQEGLPVSVMEAMASGLPIVCSNIRGNVDLIDEKGGVLFNPHDVNDCKYALEKFRFSNPKEMGEYNREKVKAFSLKRVNDQMSVIIGECLNEKYK